VEEEEVVRYEEEEEVEDAPARLVLGEAAVRGKGGRLEAAPEGLEPASLLAVEEEAGRW